MTMQAISRPALMMLVLGAFTLHPAQGQTTCKFAPRVAGTVRNLPELHILERAPVGSQPQSRYFKTTPQNREFRRAFIEFVIPDFGAEMVSALLVLPESRGTTSFPLPPDTHELSYYPADLIVDTADYSRPTTPLATFQTDPNIPPQTFSFDVTSLLAQAGCGALGFRVKLSLDPLYNNDGFLGSAFTEPVSGSTPRIEVVLRPGAPACLPSLNLEASGSDTLLAWNASIGATSYDVVRGELLNLRTRRGFSGTVQECIADDRTTTSLVFMGTPPTGDGFWFLVRPGFCALCGTYGDGLNRPDREFSRDYNITACPCP